VQPGLRCFNLDVKEKNESQGIDALQRLNRVPKYAAKGSMVVVL
jgi:hypothetical protein